MVWLLPLYLNSFVVELRLFKMLLPCVEKKDFVEGSWMKIPDLCLRCRKCLEKLEKTCFPFKCSKGFSVYRDAEGRVYPGLFILGYFDKNVAKKCPDKIVVKFYQLKELLEYEEKTHSVKFYEELFHETRQFNSQISSLSERLSKLDGENEEQASCLGLSIFHISSLISKRFLELDLCTNERLLEFSKKKKVGIYKKFDKMRIIHVNCVKKPKISFSGHSTDIIYAADLFDLLPFLLLDNAKKYTHPNGFINVVFSKNKNGEPEVCVENLSEYIPEEELPHLTERNFRGSNSACCTGLGLGMWLVKKLCDFHNIDISFSVEKSAFYSMDSYQYVFRTNLCFKDFVEIPDA